ncbi:hypothetical protein BDW02DRAFT_338005 [Decorospora gaudefroyi]|uniref:Uncharacterized protein n=1 Tax=Decorospora gaudefroyi TaxID=184978 RepID=A0A6A5KRM9_9PLEO|nr:hypothetical protein BDW02DRAFT_338005 [Decorospora gaudefroyi]
MYYVVKQVQARKKKEDKTTQVSQSRHLSLVGRRVCNQKTKRPIFSLHPVYAFSNRFIPVVSSRPCHPYAPCPLEEDKQETRRRKKSTPPPTDTMQKPPSPGVHPERTPEWESQHRMGNRVEVDT